MTDYREINTAGYHIDKVIEELLNYKRNGELVYTVFNGQELYSDTATIDGIYLKVYGKTKSERLQEIEEYQKRQLAKEEAFNKAISDEIDRWIEKGRKILDPTYYDLWNECVPIQVKGIYRGLTLKCALEVIELLNTHCDIQKAVRAFEDQNHSGLSSGIVASIIKDFCDRGLEFYHQVISSDE